MHKLVTGVGQWRQRQPVSTVGECARREKDGRIRPVVNIVAVKVADMDGGQKTGLGFSS